jgi:hypothetical protein
MSGHYYKENSDKNWCFFKKIASRNTEIQCHGNFSDKELFPKTEVLGKPLNFGIYPKICIKKTHFPRHHLPLLFAHCSLLIILSLPASVMPLDTFFSLLYHKLNYKKYDYYALF